MGMDSENPKGVFVTGGSSGIGLAITRYFMDRGYQVGVFSRSADQWADTHPELMAYGDRMVPFAGDVRDKSQVVHAVQRFVEQSHDLTAVVASAGVNHRQAAELFPDTQFNAILDTNVRGSFYLAQAAFPYFQAKRRGAVVFIASLMGHLATKYTVPYAASKGAVIQLTKALAVEWAEWNIRVNAITPGYLETPLTAKALAQSDFRQRILARTPTHRLVHVDEVANLCFYLVENAPMAITGDAIVIDGGFLAGDASLVATDR